VDILPVTSARGLDGKPILNIHCQPVTDSHLHHTLAQIPPDTLPRARYCTDGDFELYHECDNSPHPIQNNLLPEDSSNYGWT